MNRNRTRFVVMVSALLALATLPLAATGTAEQSGTAAYVEPSAELKAFFAERGVDPQYLGLPRSEVPAEQWSLINRIVATADVEDADTDEFDYGDDHDVLNSLVFESLYAAADTVGRPVRLSLGSASWSHELTADDDSDTDIYGDPVADPYPTPRG